MRGVDLEYGARTPISGVELCRYFFCLLGGCQGSVSSAVFLVVSAGDGRWRQKACAPGAYSACLVLPCRVLSAVALLRPDSLVYFAWLTVECLLCIRAVYTHALVPGTCI